jgi:hypothetical protein
VKSDGVCRSRTDASQRVVGKREKESVNTFVGERSYCLRFQWMDGFSTLPVFGGLPSQQEKEDLFYFLLFFCFSCYVDGK